MKLNSQWTSHKLVLVAFLATILFVQEEALAFLPNIQLTVFLLVLYVKKTGWQMTSVIIGIHVFLDSLAMGSLNLVYTPFMLVGWLWIPLLLSTIFKRIKDVLPLALLGILFALLYSWTFLIAQAWFYQVNLLAYLMADLPYETLLAISSFLSILWLYDPCAKVFDRMYHQ